ncbi:hypothetical protein, partial [Mesorhizobium japonicum]|uniref:hypothetical protein n=1 Tax=Mesorhizobium japonicum TaxID=2066070 RepID=UPI003B5AC0ED
TAGAKSAVRSIPAAIANSNPASGFIARAREILSTLKDDFDLGVEHGFERHLIDLGHKNPSAAASGWQHSGAYPHPDAWHNGIAQTGDIFEAGVGGPVSNFVVEGGTTAAMGHDMNAIWEGAQVGADADWGYRTATYLLQVNSDVPVAHSIVAANPHFGAGGLHQTYFPDITANIQNGQVVIISAKTHLPIDPKYLSYTDVTNSAGDVLHTEVWLDLGADDKVALHGMPRNPEFLSKQEAVAMFADHAPYAPVLGAAGNAVSGAIRVQGAFGQGEG